MDITEVGGHRFAVLAAEGSLLTDESVALDIIGEAFGTDADLIAIPKSRLPVEFLRLSTGVLGAVAQKFTNYGIPVGFVGDFSGELADSRALRDFFAETNKGRTFLFAADLEEMAELLSP